MSPSVNSARAIIVRAMRRLLVIAVMIAMTPACSAFGESAERLRSTPTVTSASPAAASPAAPATAGDGLPLIVVQSPQVDAETASPLVVRGTADVYRAVIHVRLIGEDGSLISGVDTKATCGTGCRGEFRVVLFFFVEEVQPATVEVYGDSERDGSPAGVVRVPVTVFP